MSLSRRDFMKLVGISVSSLLLTRCNFPIGVTCYAPLPPSPYPTDDSPRGRLRLCWLSFGELSQKTIEEANQGTADNTFGGQLVADHRAALDELVASAELSPAVADLVQEAYGAAVYHVWRSSAPMTCYEPMMVDYAPVSAGILVQQASALDDIAGQGTIDPATLENARAALEHDMAYYAMTDAEVSSLYDRIVTEWESQGGPPSFEELDLAITPDARAAAQFIISLLTGE
jgi:hypothetical protein